MDRIERNLRLYWWYCVFIFTPCYLPVVVLFWKQSGLDMFEVYALQGLFALSMVLLEVPTGMVADRIGKRASLRIGAGFLFLGLLLYSLSSTFWLFFASELLMACGAALFSGADSAFLYDSLDALGRSEEFSHFEGRTRSIQMVSLGLSTLIGGFLGQHAMRWTFVLSAIGPAICVALSFFFVEAQPKERPVSLQASRLAYRQLIKDALYFVTRHRLVLWLLATWAVTAGSLNTLLWMYQPYMKFTGLPVWAFGIAFASFNVVAAVTSHYAGALRTRWGDNGILLLMGLGVLLAPFLMSIMNHPLGFMLIFSNQFARGLFRPVLGPRLMEYTFADKRATVLSLASLSRWFFFALFAPLIGLIAKYSTVQTTLLLQGVVLSCVFGVMVFLYRQIPAKYFEVKASVTEHQ
ncbi:MAG: hypothetical protein CL920_25115 [Deltaproteobacteria bacterium]|nr:hypothetical protein [Deltaproteobacteria bacterium]MBU51986.1 hypothetical protein [Deltaproteobacteria bacterium]|tara:strand:+ start:7783 stop:9006 length:1224 start_codon:yes stop_codon:yes gene_type:complete